MKEKNIVILGAGFAGLRVAKLLSKKIPKYSGYKIKLVDKRNFHLYTPDLYEVATAFNEKITDDCLLRLRETVATPINNLIDHERVEFVFDRVLEVDFAEKKVRLGKYDELAYDYLVVAMGAQVNTFGIEGMEEYSYPLKTVGQALAINCGLDQYFHALWNKREHKKPLSITICGGGATGVETVAEMVLACNKLCEKYQYERKNITIQLIESGNDLLRFGEKGSAKVLKRLENLGVKVYLNNMVTKAAKESLNIKSKDGEEKTLVSHITIWTGGVKVNSIVAKSIGAKERRGAAIVNEYLQYKDNKDVFVLGDNAFIEDGEGGPVPWLAQMAVKEADTVVANLCALLNKKDLKKFVAPRKIPVIIPVGGKYAFIKMGSVVLGGYIFYVLRRLVDLRYYLTIMPFSKAYGKWHRGKKIFEAND